MFNGDGVLRILQLRSCLPFRIERLLCTQDMPPSEQTMVQLEHQMNTEHPAKPF
jgi:hypothetical protein